MIKTVQMMTISQELVDKHLRSSSLAFLIFHCCGTKWQEMIRGGLVSTIHHLITISSIHTKVVLTLGHWSKLKRNLQSHLYISYLHKFLYITYRTNQNINHKKDFLIVPSGTYLYSTIIFSSLHDTSRCNHSMGSCGLEDGFQE